MFTLKQTKNWILIVKPVILRNSLGGGNSKLITTPY